MARCGLVAFLACAVIGCGGGEAAPPQPLAVAAALGGDQLSGFQRALAPRPFSFPRDHGPHPDFRTEWWYFTGSLRSRDGRAFGYQLTVFRIALAPQSPALDSSWRTRQLYMGHLALTDVEAGKHYAVERFSRGAVGLAGAEPAPFRVWLEDWDIAGGAQGLLPLRIRAAAAEFAIDLTLSAGKPLVLQGDRGLSQKSAAPGNASYYYSYTRLPSAGTLQVGDERMEVSGSSWLDREWSTSALGPEQSGWDWFALQLADGRDLMYYRLRQRSGGAAPESAGVLVARDGNATRLEPDQVVLEPLRNWISPQTGDRYPIAWRLQVPAHDLDLLIQAAIPDQEMRLTVRYWEGAVAVSGSQRGVGYLEMTRYEGTSAAVAQASGWPR